MALNVFEALQLLVSMVGAGLEAVALLHVRQDAVGLTNHGERIVARASIERSTALLLAQLMLVVVGVVSVVVPRDAFWQPIRVSVVRMVLMAVSVVLMAKSVRVLQRRREQIAYLVAEERRRREE
jgi:hypothetical protein